MAIYFQATHTHIYVLYVTRKNIYVCIFLRFKIFPSDNFILFFFFFFTLQHSYWIGFWTALLFRQRSHLKHQAIGEYFYKRLTRTCRYSLPIVVKQKWRWFTIERAINQRLTSKTPPVAKFLNGSFNTLRRSGVISFSSLSHGHRSLSKTHTRARIQLQTLIKRVFV